MQVDAPRLRQKLDILRDTHIKDFLIAGLLTNQDDSEKLMTAAMLSRAQTDERFPVNYVAALVRQYGLRPPQTLLLKNPQHQVWFDLLAEPDLDAFVARVRLLDGEVPTAAPAGSRWQQFLHQYRDRADALGRSRIQVDRLDKPLALDGFSYRAMQQGTWVDGLSRREPGLVLDAGERIIWMLTVGQLIQPSVNGEIHLFAFYDIAIDGKRLYVPLLPSLGVDGQPLGASVTQGPFVEIPHESSRGAPLVVDSGWDERALTVVATAEPLDPLILEDALLEGPILAERLYLLAVRLRQAEHSTPGSTAVMRKSYRVNQAEAQRSGTMVEPHRMARAA